MKRPRLFTFSRFCWSIIIAGLIAQGVNWYYTSEPPIVELDEWGESIPLAVRDDTLSAHTSSGGTSYGGITSDGDYTALKIDSLGAAYISIPDDNALRVAIVNDGFGSEWTRLRTAEQGYLQCENIDKERWALIPKGELDKFKAYKSRQLR